MKGLDKFIHSNIERHSNTHEEHNIKVTLLNLAKAINEDLDEIKEMLKNNITTTDSILNDNN